MYVPAQVIVLGIVAHEPGCRAFGSDLSPEAVKLARDNAVFMGLDNKVEFRVGDLFEPYFSDEFFGKVDLISCNPPYISSRKAPELNPEISDYEPHMAFDGGPHGINIMRRLINESPQFLQSRSFLCFEVGLGQGGIVERMLRNSNQYDEIRPLADDNSNVGAFIARTNR
jgi:release factor glutamine methyltransferase